jgi:hypothetical protein
LQGSRCRRGSKSEQHAPLFSAVHDLGSDCDAVGCSVRPTHQPQGSPFTRRRRQRVQHGALVMPYFTDPRGAPRSIALAEDSLFTFCFLGATVSQAVWRFEKKPAARLVDSLETDQAESRHRAYVLSILCYFVWPLQSEMGRQTRLTACERGHRCQIQNFRRMESGPRRTIVLT